MIQSRATLQRAINRLVNLRDPEERASAAAEATEAIQAFVASGEFLDQDPDVTTAAAMTNAQLGSDRVSVSDFSDADLKELNQLLPWAAMTADQSGRIIGAPWSNQKRNAVHALLESRQLAFNEAYPLAGKHVMEFGCFEGIHTLGLLLLGARVTAIDGRVENTLKTLARLWAYGRACDVRLWNFEQPRPTHVPEQCDAVHHIGVLYHLSNPVEHLDEILPRTREALLLDTHVALDEAEARATYTVRGRTFRYRPKKEPHAETAPFAGMREHAKYLLLDDLLACIGGHGFKDVRTVDDRVERNGRRVTIWAFR